MSEQLAHAGEATVKPLFRSAIVGDAPNILASVYEDDTNIIVWQRELADELVKAAQCIVEEKPTLQAALTVSPETVYTSLTAVLGDSSTSVSLSKDIAELVDMFCCLFDIKQAGLRLATLASAMCPRFHVDRVPCRLVTTYQGMATEWLQHDSVDRSKLGRASHGLSDDVSGVFRSPNDIQYLAQGDVALLKGELWPGNEDAGLVHRSPCVTGDNRRLILTLDFV